MLPSVAPWKPAKVMLFCRSVGNLLSLTFQQQVLEVGNAAECSAIPLLCHRQKGVLVSVERLNALALSQVLPEETPAQQAGLDGVVENIMSSPLAVELTS